MCLGMDLALFMTELARGGRYAESLDKQGREGMYMGLGVQQAYFQEQIHRGKIETELNRGLAAQADAADVTAVYHNSGMDINHLHMRMDMMETGMTMVKTCKTKFIAPVNKPSGVAITQRGEVVVSEGGVSVFSPEGKRLRSFGVHQSKSRNPPKLPCAIAVDGEGNIIICCSCRIMKYTAEGQYLGGVGVNGSGPLQFRSPRAIAYSVRNEKLYITERGNHRIQILKSDLTFSSTIGKYGNGKGEFDTPAGVGCDSTGKVYVADSRNHRIQIFTAKEEFVTMFSVCGQDRHLKYPRWIAIDTNDIVYVTEKQQCNVAFVFTSEGEHLTQIKLDGKEIHGIAAMNGSIFICYNNYIEVM